MGSFSTSLYLQNVSNNNNISGRQFRVYYFSSVGQSCRLFVTPWNAACQAYLSITSSQSLLKLMCIDDAISDAIQPSHPVVPFSHLQSFPASGTFQMSQLFTSGGQSIRVSASTSVLPVLQNGLVGSPCSPRDSQESSPTLQFKSIHSLVLSFLYSPTVTSIHDYWKNHSLD